MVITIKTQSTKITTKAKAGDLIPKNIGVQIKLVASCAKKYFTATLFCFFFSPFSQTRYKEIPINKYSTVHTGPKSQFGGAKKGLFKLLYQLGIAEMVKGVPAKPTNSHKTIDTKSLDIFFINIIMK